MRSEDIIDIFNIELKRMKMHLKGWISTGKDFSGLEKEKERVLYG
jgi:hypothetical protein